MRKTIANIFSIFADINKQQRLNNMFANENTSCQCRTFITVVQENLEVLGYIYIYI